MKPIHLTVHTECAAANKDYNAVVQEDNIQDVMHNQDYLRANREMIVNEFMALVLLDATDLIYKHVQGVIDGAQTTDN